MINQQGRKQRRSKAHSTGPARLKDIAQELGLSTVTISKVLRGHPDIGEETRARVLKRMKELNYQPNFAARALITGRTWTIGLVVPDLLHPFFALVAKAISADIRGQGYSLIITSSEDDPELEREEIGQLLAKPPESRMPCAGVGCESRGEALSAGNQLGHAAPLREPLGCVLGRDPEFVG